MNENARYLQLARALPRPTSQQIRAFASFVAHHHSWYKKLPMRGAGEPFFFYLDTYPHAVRIRRERGGHAWRDIIRVPSDPEWIPRWGVDVRDGDIEPAGWPLSYLSGGVSSAEYREQRGSWSYWNWGAPEQPRADALAQAAEHVCIPDHDGEPVPVPIEALERGLVYLRATVYGDMGSRSDEFQTLRAAHGLPPVEVDAAAQRLEMVSAMERVVAWVYDA